MADEIERRFLLDRVPADVEVDPGVRLRQGYVAIDRAVNVRVRDEGGRYVLTLKGGAGLTRTEIERGLDRAEFEALWLFTEGRRIEKTRHRIAIGDAIAEVDVFAGDLDGVILAEVEFTSAESARAFRPPSWFGREVTEEPAWNNAALAEHGAPTS
jgi:adenylate cyclase